MLPPEVLLCFVATTTAGTWCAGLRQLAAWRQHAAHDHPKHPNQRRTALALTSPGVNPKVLFRFAVVLVFFPSLLLF